MLFVVNAQGVPSVASIVKIGRPDGTAPGAPTAVTATPRRRGVVTWTAPNNGGSTISSYTVTPYVGGVAQTPTTVTGNPPAPSATVTGLTNGTTYTFTVTATNAVGTGPASAPSNVVTPTAGTAPTFVQQKSARATGTTLKLIPPQAVAARGPFSSPKWPSGAPAAPPPSPSAPDSAGNTSPA